MFVFIKTPRDPTLQERVDNCAILCFLSVVTHQLPPTECGGCAGRMCDSVFLPSQDLCSAVLLLRTISQHAWL